MSDIAVRLDGVSKQYYIGRWNLYGRIGNRIRHGLRRVGRALVMRPPPPVFQPPVRQILWALDGVSFEVPRGQSVAILGRNGAGKSTLLKILARITRPTRGHVDLYGSMGALLEVGTGFHHELTGRENVFLNAAILGMEKREIARRFDEIVAFAEIEKFIDTPMKFYSSGMFMRLAFAVSAHLDSQILLLDEVLAVGDAAFTEKCLSKMEGATRVGRTVIFVSHSTSAVRAVCTRAIWLDQGKVRMDGPVREVTDAYLAVMVPGRPTHAKYPELPELPAQILRAEIAPGDPGGSCVFFHCEYRLRERRESLLLCVDVLNRQGVNVLHANDDSVVVPGKRAIGRHSAVLRIPTAWLAPGEYFVSYRFSEPGREATHAPADRLSFARPEETPTRFSAHALPWPSVIFDPRPSWEISSLPEDEGSPR